MKNYISIFLKIRTYCRVCLKQIIPVSGLLFSVCTYSQDVGEDYINEPFFDDFDGKTVNTDVWQVASWSEHGGQTSPERCFVSGGYLNMVFINDSKAGYLSAAIQTRNEFLYGKWEARLKPSSVPGVLNSFYTIDWNNTADESSTSNGTKQEIDIEFLTYTFGGSDGKIHYAVHAEDKESFNLNPDLGLGFDPSEDFHIYGFEITPDYIEWIVDDKVLQKYTYSENDISIYAPYQLKLNVWSKESWINGPPAPDVECLYLIDWIRFTPASGNTGTEKMNNINEIKLHNYPNPFQESTTIEFYLKQESYINLSVFNSSGQLLMDHMQGWESTGQHRLVIDGTKLQSGIYMYRLLTNYGSFMGKFVVFK